MIDEKNIYNIERAVLSSFIFETNTFENTTLNEKDFSLPFHQKIFKIFKNLQSKNKPIADDFIKIEMEKDNIYDEKSFLELLSTNPISNYATYEQEIKEFSQNKNYTLKVKQIINDENLSIYQKTTQVTQLEESTLNKLGTSLPLVQNTKNIKAKTPTFYLENDLPIQQKEITMITGKGGGGKSFVAIWIASMLIEVENLKVFAYLSEDSVENSKNRLKIIRKHNPQLQKADFDIWGKESRPLSFIKKRNHELFPSDYWYQFIRHFKAYDVIILDPLIAFIAEDENSNTEARFLFNLLNQWCEKENKTIILIHHHNKNNETRGASAFVDAVRLHYVTSKKENNDTSRFLKLEKTNHYTGKNEFEVRLFRETTSLEKVQHIIDDKNSRNEFISPFDLI